MPCELGFQIHSADPDYGANAVSVNGRFQDKKCVPKRKAVSPSLKQLGDNIRRERMGAGITQQQLAELADLNIRNVQRIEAGEFDVLLSTTLRIRKAIGCPLEKLIPKDWS
jgi:DNA-binding XRE family transcriptional regulator